MSNCETGPDGPAGEFDALALAISRIPVLIISGQNRGDYVPIGRVLETVHQERKREQKERQTQNALAQTKTLTDLLLTIQRELRNRDPDQRANLTLEDVTTAFLNKISEIQSGTK